jgi:hypothetical protein
MLRVDEMCINIGAEVTTQVTPQMRAADLRNTHVTPEMRTSHLRNARHHTSEMGITVEERRFSAA